MAYTRKRKSPYKAKRKPRSAPKASKGAAIAGTLAAAAGTFGWKLLKNKLGLNTEMHWVDFVETNVGTSTTISPFTYPLTIAVGDSVNQRTGSSIRLQSYRVNGYLQTNTAATQGCLVRIIFVKFRQTRGNSITTQFLDSSSRITSHYNRGDSISATGYTILYDKTFALEKSGSGRDNIPFEFDYSPTEHHVKFDASGTAGGVTETEDGFIRGYIMTSESTANTPNYWVDHRVSFVDN